MTQDRSGQDFTGAVLTYTVAGRVTEAGSPLAGVCVSTTGGISATTNSGGAYTLTGLISNTYVVTPSRSQYTFAPATGTVSVPPSRSSQDFGATLLRYGSPGW